MLDIKKSNEIILTTKLNVDNKDNFFIKIPNDIIELMGISYQTILEVSIKKVENNG